MAMIKAHDAVPGTRTVMPWLSEDPKTRFQIVNTSQHLHRQYAVEGCRAMSLLIRYVRCVRRDALTLWPSCP